MYDVGRDAGEQTRRVARRWGESVSVAVDGYDGSMTEGEFRTLLAGCCEALPMRLRRHRRHQHHRKRQCAAGTLTVAEAAAQIGISRAAAYAAVRSGKFSQRSGSAGAP
jgi:hypothetical protein